MSQEPSKREIIEQDFAGSASFREKLAMGCTFFFLALCAYTWLRYRFELLVAAVPLLFIAVYLILFCMIPPVYVFTKEALEIRQRFSKTRRISYDSVFNIDSDKHDHFINITVENRVVIYYEERKTKKAFHCLPRDVDGFLQVMKNNCPVFHEETPESTSLDVFFHQ